MAEAGFGSRLAGAVAERESQLVLGLDPDPRRLWAGSELAARGAGDGSPAARAAAAVAEYCRALIAAAGPACVAAKLQLACFERLGAPGWRALATVAEHARAAGLLVLADAKRGDIDVSAAAYGEAFFGGLSTPFGDVAGLGADALTVNPYLGGEALAPLAGAARAARAGLFVLVRTSNPGAAELQDLALAPPPPGRGIGPYEHGETVSERVAELVATLGGAPAAAGVPSDVGAVVGATAPGLLERLRALMPHAPFLLPGVGAQGGRVEDLAPAFAPGPAFGLVSASRAIANAHEQRGGDPGEAARREAERLRALAWGLAAG